jgi:Zn-dependent protease with chaperone function
MNFFEHQDQARSNTRTLVILFSLAIVALIAITTAFIAGLIYYFEHHNQQRFVAIDRVDGGQTSNILQLLTPELVGAIAVVILAVVAIGSFYKLMQLSGGGDRVAASLGGRLVSPDSREPQERKLLNVVEEMAIASGTPVPPVYLMEEQGINAFAAGYSPSDAVIGVTRGCMEQLDRNQLQGVIAHEFSHILHGDMRLNIRLIGVLHGIMVIGLIGQMILRSGSHRHHHHRHSTSSRDKNAAGNMVLGLGLVVIGYVGTFFGNLIKSAVSRQREFLADASAVQFTRNPEGISQALQKIGGYSHGSRLGHGNAAEFSHMYFGAGIRSAMSGWMATHPPLQDRIKRIEPGWSGGWISAEPDGPLTSESPDPETIAPETIAPDTKAPSTEAISGLAPVSTSGMHESFNAEAIQLMDSIGNPSAKHLQQARALLQVIPEFLKDAARDPFSARAVVYALLIHDNEHGQKQWQQLKQRAHPVVFKHLQTVHQEIQQLSPDQKLPLLELSVPALKSLSEPQYRLFKKNLTELIKVDREVEVFEWALYRILVHALEPRKPVSGNQSLTNLGSACQQLLSTLTWVGHTQYKDAEDAYNAAINQLGLKDLALLGDGGLSGGKPSFQILDRAVRDLNRLKPLQKPALLKAMMTCIQHDGVVSRSELELFRAVADCLDCPVPPLS